MAENYIQIEVGVDDLFDKTLPNPEMLDYYNRISRREIMLNCEIDDTCIEYAKQIMEWNIADKDIPVDQRKPISIYIHSGGGNMSSAWALIDAMILSETPIRTIGIGCMYSAASMIFLAGHKRYCMPHSTYMIHDGYSQSADSIAKMIDNIEFTKRGEAVVKDFYLSRTNITSELYDQKYRVNWYFDTEEMLKYHIADEVITSLYQC